MRWGLGIALIALVAAPAGSAESSRLDPDRACIDCVAPQLLALLPADVRYERRSIPDEHNGFVALHLAVETLVSRTERELSDPARERWLARNRTALGLIDDALAAPAFQLPLWDVGMRWAPYRELAWLKVARTHTRAANGDIEGATNDAADTFVLSQRMLAGDPLLLTQLISLSIESIALDGLRHVMADRNVSPAVLERLIQLLQSAPNLCVSYDLALRVEATTFLLPQLVGGDVSTPDARIERMLDMSQGGAACRSMQERRPELGRQLRTNVDAFDPADTVRVAAQLVAHGMKQCRMAPATRSSSTESIFGPAPALDGIVAKIVGDEASCTSEHSSASTAPGSPAINPIGRCWLRRSQWAYYPTRIQAERDATLFLLAARSHEIQSGRLPSTLQALAGTAGLTALPTDPFADAPFHYDPARRIIWSIGEDGIDQDGHPIDGTGTIGDLVWTIPPLN